MKCHSQYKEEEVIVRFPSSRESIPRRVYIKRGDVSDSKYGLTIGCRACKAANRELVGIHSECCRANIEKEIAAREPERSERVYQVLTKFAKQDEGTPDEVAQSTGSNP